VTGTGAGAAAESVIAAAAKAAKDHSGKLKTAAMMLFMDGDFRMLPSNWLVRWS
jgi:hypothetical protein